MTAVVRVCDLAGLPDEAAAMTPHKIVTLVNPGTPLPEVPGTPEDRRLRLFFHDLTERADAEEVLADLALVARLLDFARAVEPPGLLIHCYAGFSRSTAAALAVLALHNPGREAEAARLLRAAGPHAVPNRLVLTLADRLLGGDRLVRALEAMPPPTSAVYERPMTLPLRLDGGPG